MKPIRLILTFASILLIATAPTLHAQQQQPAPPTTLAATLDRQITNMESQLFEVANAMPGDKFNFSPASLNIPGAAYKDVRTFAGQLKHIAASNYFIWSPLTGDKLPESLKDGDGPEGVKTKAEILQFLKDSFAQGHKAAAAFTAANMLDPVGRSKSPRLQLAYFGVSHASDHYGQLVEYLRMNGIIPPASRSSN